MNLTGKVALVTGASKGIGAGIAAALAGAGAAVIVNYASDREGAEKVVAEITAAGGKATAVQADVANTEAVSRMFDTTKKEYGRLDILVNNAGIYGFTPIGTISDEQFYKYYDINVLGTIHCIQSALDLFTDEGGSIVNIGSAVVSMNVPGSLVYTST